MLITRYGSEVSEQLRRAIDRYRKARVAYNPALHAKVFMSIERDRLLVIVGSGNFTNGSTMLDEAAVLLDLPPLFRSARKLVAHLTGTRHPGYSRRTAA
jgi:hypothetical protein